MHEKFIVYQTRCKINNKIYIGIHRTLNLDDGYLGSGTALNLAISKYGRDAFEREIIYEGDSYLEILEKERQLVDRKFVKRKDTYNIMIGGQKPPDRTGAKITDTTNYSNESRSRWTDPEYKKRVSSAMRKPKSVKWTDEQRDAQRERKLGISRSDSTKQNMSKAWVKRSIVYKFFNEKTNDSFVGTTKEFVNKYDLNIKSAATRFCSAGKYQNWVRNSLN